MIPCSLPPQFLLPSWNLRQLVSIGQTVYHYNDIVSWIQNVGDNDRRNTLFTNSTRGKTPFRFNTRILLAKFHSSPRKYGLENGEPLTSGLGEEQKSDTTAGKEPTLVKYLISEKKLSSNRSLSEISMPDRIVMQKELPAIPKQSQLIASPVYQPRDVIPDMKPENKNSDINVSNLSKKEAQVQISHLDFSPEPEIEDLRTTTGSQPKNDTEKKSSYSNQNSQFPPINKAALNPVSGGSNDLNITPESTQKRSNLGPVIVKSQDTIPYHSWNTISAKSKSEASENGSLFDELFPEELTKKSKAMERQRKAIITLETLPIFNWKPQNGLKDSYADKKTSPKKRKKHVKSQAKTSPPLTWLDLSKSPTLENTSILTLSASCNSLEESDFFRLGSKGQHIETWTNGIIKVIPVRDEVTFRCLGSYLILFTTEIAARTYLKQISKLHRLSRIKVQNDPLMLPIPPKYLDEGESPEDLLRNFSLVPGYSRLTLKLLRRPFKPRILRILANGGIIGHIRRKTSTDHMVLFYLDAGNISLSDLQDFMNHDGKRRNLYWKVAGGLDAIVEIKYKEGLRHSTIRDTSTEGKPQEKTSCYVLPFMGENEARRFVREWHRQEFPIPQRKQNNEDTCASIINAEILW